MTEKFRNKKKLNQNKKITNDSNNSSILDINNSKSYLSNSINLPTLSKLIKTEEDFLFKSDRKIQNDNDIYNIENKIEQKVKNANINDFNKYERENYISNRDTTLPKKIIDKEYEKLSITQKDENSKKKIDNIKVNDNFNKNINNKNKKKEKNCLIKTFGKEYISFKIFLLIILFIMLVLLFLLSYFVFFKN